MKKLTYLFTLAIALCPTAITAQETIDTISLSDLEQLQQLACTGNSSSPELQTSLQDLDSTLTQVLATYGVELTEEQLQSAYDEASTIQSQLATENSVQEFCSSY